MSYHQGAKAGAIEKEEADRKTKTAQAHPRISSSIAGAGPRLTLSKGFLIFRFFLAIGAIRRRLSNRELARCRDGADSDMMHTCAAETQMTVLRTGRCVAAAPVRR